MGGPKSVACPQSLRCRQSQMEELLQPSVEAICMALFGIVERLSAAGMGAALEEAARGFEVFGELAEIGRVVLVATRALDGRAASLLGLAACGGTRRARSPSCFAPSRPMMSGRRRRQVQAWATLRKCVSRLRPQCLHLVSRFVRREQE